MGTCAVGIGAAVRQPSLRTRAGTVAGRAMPVPRTALEMAATNVGLDWLEFLCSADAQQLSACAWLMTRCDSELCESPLCIGHALSAQHAMRASGVGTHPAQIAALPAEMSTVRASANNRLLRVSTRLGCRTGRQVSTRLQSGGYSGVSRRIRIAPFRTTNAMTVATSKSGTGELNNRTRTAATITPRFAMTSFVVKIQLAFMCAPPPR